MPSYPIPPDGEYEPPGFDELTILQVMLIAMLTVLNMFVALALHPEWFGG